MAYTLTANLPSGRSGHKGSQRQAMEDRDFWRNERIAFLALTAVNGIGFWSLHKIAQANYGFKEALRAPGPAGVEKPLAAAGYDGEPGQESLWSEGIALARTLTSLGVRLIFKAEAEFPEKLRAIPDAPEWIFIQGIPENLSKPSVAVVGTRKPSDDGLFLTKYVLGVLARIGCVTVSGLALGIDQVAHISSIRYSLPTVAVLGTGILQNYPKGSNELREEILKAGGSIVSEYLPNQSYSAENFVRRNRIQAALCDVLIPSEWSIKSGTAHTVKYASRYEKRIVNVFLPGTQNSRPEIPFSAAEYRASWYEVPTKTESLIQFLKSVLLEAPESMPTSTADLPVEKTIDTLEPESEKESHDTIEANGLNQPSQLPLI
ncbi:DNA-processing protein DprA [Pseudomonas canadensis]|uniref:DNA-processing protein DprA n=1 Tax=Pseudomonas canadensis TaxID=915099 RepID=UPI0028933D17|nr:DNA-processing protein DprA [Pseudomonas canadensis]WNJ84761.1 DNA-processing protein DprA [Pseudomonas canadensis]